MVTENPRIKQLENLRAAYVAMADAIDEEIAEIMIEADSYKIPLLYADKDQQKS